MPACIASSLRSYRRQNLLTEFASLKHVQPQGIYVSLTPGDPSLWSGVLFVREGPYAPAVLRFRIHFPPTYPHTAPLVTFNTDVFHPLIFDATRSSQNTGSALDNASERPPPGALNLRHGFSCWRKTTTAPPTSSPNVLPIQVDTTLPQNKTSSLDAPESQQDESSDPRDVYVVDVLRYMRIVFEDAALLDSLPFEEAANQSAWYAWRASKHSAHAKSPTLPQPPSSIAPTAATESPDTPTASTKPVDGNAPSTPIKAARKTVHPSAGSVTPKPTPKKPSEWKWEGVWEARARKGIEASVTNASLFGASGLRDDEIHFVSVDSEEIEGMRTELHTHLREA